jgi:hypothetical protein
VSQAEGEVSGPELVDPENSPSPEPTTQDIHSDTVIPLTQLMAQDKDLLREQIAQPAGALGIVLALLAEATEPMSLEELKSQLVKGNGFSATSVTKGFKGLLVALRANPLVVVTEAEKSPSEQENQAPSVGKGRRNSGVMRRTPRFSLAAKVDIPARVEPVAEPSEPVDGPPTENSSLATTGRDEAREDSQSVTTIVERLITGDFPSQATLFDLPADDVGRLLANVDEKALVALVKAAATAGRNDATIVLLATPRASKQVATLIRDWPESPESQALLASGVGWLLQGSVTGTSKRILGELARPSFTLSEPVVVSMLQSLLTVDAPCRSQVLGILATVPPKAVEACVRGIDVNAVLGSVKNEPLAKRARLLWGAWRTQPACVESKAVWGRQLRLEDIEAVATMPTESAILESPWVRAQIVEPLVIPHIRETSSRAGLGRVLTWPACLGDAVPADVLAAAIRRVSATDAGIGLVVASLSQQDEVERIRKELDETTARLHRAEEAEVAARAAADEAREAEARSFAKAASAERQQVSASQGELRQARIEGIRGLVDGLAEVGRLPGKPSRDAVVAQLLSTARLHGIEAIGPVGVEMPYDPALHELLGDEDADMIEVKELGFALKSTDGLITIRRAAVVRVAQ